MDFPYGEAVIRQRAVVTTDPYSNTTTGQNWTTPATSTITGCGFNPGSSSEPLEVGRTAVITKPEVYAPPGADVLSGDRLVVRGVTYEVSGRPQQWISPFTGWAPGLVVQLDLVEG